MLQQTAGFAFETGSILSIEAAGTILVRSVEGTTTRCLWLENAAAPIALLAGDQVLFVRTNSEQGVVVGRVGVYSAPEASVPPKQLTLEATEVLSLKCGDVSIDLRAADGKLMMRGEDVLLRAKGTQRIKAGSVNIN
ncbi:hypothetical protein VVD49_13800 [Uliginosibacterium sp. H3]|uniref:Uncharacterized protein n=1 Tax=Uliginosibacterium silvisoli TaxID=3114758 RepID=A0ABU6K5C9_9RHOO|nr:hypothetical protein [Uliginosibacterium sp. H3]